MLRSSWEHTQSCARWAQPTCGLAGKWSDRFACDDARSCGPCLFTSADDGRQDTTLTCLYPNDWGPFAQVIDAADPWCGLTCTWGFFTGTLVVFVTLLIGQKLRRAPRQHKGNDGDRGIGSRQTPTDSQVGPQRQLPISPQRPAQRDIPRFHVDRPTFAQQNVATVHREMALSPPRPGVKQGTCCPKPPCSM